jgi:NADPH2:quinone reductase
VQHTRIIVTHYGGPDAIQAIEEECPEPKAGEVCVRVLAAGVSLPDIMAREGVHPETPSVRFAPADRSQHAPISRHVVTAVDLVYANS